MILQLGTLSSLGGYWELWIPADIQSNLVVQGLGSGGKILYV